MQKLLTHTADEAARECGLVQRNRKLTGSALVQTLVFGWLANPEAIMTNSPRRLAPWGLR